MNTLAEIIKYHKARTENARVALAYAVQRGYDSIVAKNQKRINRHTAAVATLQRAVADIERLQKAWEATR